MKINKVYCFEEGGGGEGGGSYRNNIAVCLFHEDKLRDSYRIRTEGSKSLQ